MLRRTTGSLLVVLCMAAVACSNFTQPSQSGGSTASNMPKSGGALNIRVSSDPFDWDSSYQGKTTPNLDGIALAYESLVTFKTGPDVKFEEMIIEPELAEKWEISPDARTFTFNLRRGVKFANMPPVNGRELTSSDVKWSFEYWARVGEFTSLPPGQYDFMFQGLAGIDTPDPHTVIVRFKDPFVPFLTYVGTDRLPIVPHEIYDQDGHLKNRIVGTGPWQLDESASQKGSRWTWKKNPTYWGAPAPYIDEVRWLVIPDDAAALAGFRAKQVDFLDRQMLAKPNVEELAKAYPEAVVYQFAQTGAFHIHWQTQRPPLDDPRIRRAIGLGINREELSLLDGDLAVPGLAGAHRGVFTDDELKQLVRYDPDEARRLVNEVNPNGVELSWEFPGNVYGQQYISRIQLIQAQLKKVGINVTFKSMDNAEFSAKRKAKDFMINLAATDCGDDFDHDSMVYACYHSKAKNNYKAINEPELDKLLEAQRSEIDPVKRQQIIRQVATFIDDKDLAIDLYYPVRYEVWQPWLKNFAPHRGRDGTPLKNAWIDK
jgi:peptide/nickel transport system substrate-binding protein